MEEAAEDLEVETDGRHQRSARSREAVVGALLDLMRESGSQPSAQAVAERAEVSLRTVFRLFEDVDTLFAAAVAHQVRRVGGLFAPIDSTGSIPARVEAIAQRRAQLFEEVAPVRRIALTRLDHATIAEWMNRSHDELRGQVTTLFAAELNEMNPRHRRVVVEALDAVMGWPMWDSLRREQGLDTATVVEIVSHTARRLLET